MQPPDELMAQVFLPAMRQLVAIRLSSQGLRQRPISIMLGMTQASVSHYLSSGPQKAYLLLSRFEVSREEADRYSSRLADAIRKSAVEGVTSLNSIWTGLLGSGSVCRPHRELYPFLADCDMCIKEYGRLGGARAEAIAEVAEAVKMLEESPVFVRVMPEVSVNIAYAAGDADTPADVVAVPGRIVKVRDRARAMLPPEAGASVHMSKVVLLARSSRPELRACMNVRYDEKMAAAMKKKGLRTISIGNYSFPGSEDPTAEALERRLKSSPGPFDAVIDEGGSAVEPNVYLFGKGARDVAKLALGLARAYSAA